MRHQEANNAVQQRRSTLSEIRIFIERRQLASNIENHLNEITMIGYEAFMFVTIAVCDSAETSLSRPFPRRPPLCH